MGNTKTTQQAFDDELPEIESIDLDAEDCSIEEVARKILKRSFYFCNTFAPRHLDHLAQAIELSQSRLATARNADDFMKLAATNKTLHASYSGLLEQATVVLMSSCKPLGLLVEDLKRGASDDSATVATHDSYADDSTIEIDMDALGGEYRPYIDD